MRDIIFFIASLAGAVAMTAVAVLLAPESPFWRWTLVIAGSVFVGCAAAFFVDLMKPDSNSLLVFGMSAGLAVFLSFLGGVYFISDKSQKTPEPPVGADFRATFYQRFVGDKAVMEFKDNKPAVEFANPVLFVLRFDNIGNKASGIFGISLLVDLDGSQYHGTRHGIQGAFFPGGGDPPILESNDFYHKASEVVEPGHSLAGAVMFFFPELPAGKLLAAKSSAKYTLKCEDVYGREYSFVPILDSYTRNLQYPGIKYGTDSSVTNPPTASPPFPEPPALPTGRQPKP